MTGSTAKVIAITGGSRGIGAAVARLAAGRGYDVAISYRSDAEAAESVVKDIERAGRRGLAVKADVARDSDIVAFFEAIDRAFGRLDVLVNNAGIVAPRSAVADLTADRLAQMLAVNVTGSFIAAREAILRLSTRRGGRGGVIVNLSSAAAKHGSPGEFVDYAASKGAIDVFTQGLAKEVATEGIRVNAVRPGLIDTEIHASAGVPGRVKEMQGLVPMQRGGTAEEVAEAILWLASDQASYVTAALLDVGGGR
jgi:NAD(P)-dependent dehydrogenase (short-subunit alcohol dehydrogenase family)